MAIKLMKVEHVNPSYDNAERVVLKEFLCDSDADFSTLPECCTGSTAVSIESGAVMVVNTKGQWVTFGG